MDSTILKRIIAFLRIVIVALIIFLLVKSDGAPFDNKLLCLIVTTILVFVTVRDVRNYFKKNSIKDAN